MLIGIHAQAVFKNKKTGVERYAQQLIKNMAMLQDTKEHRFVLYSDSKAGGEIEFPDNFSIKVLRSPFLWTQLRLAMHILFKRPKALLIPAHVLPILSHPKNSTVVIHDIAFEFFPQAYSDSHRRYLKFTTKHALKRAKKIIVPSESTKNDILRFYDWVDDKKIFVVHHGIEQHATDNSQAPSSNFNFPYFLYVGRLEIKKNILGILKAFDIFKGIHKSPHKLVLVGKFGFGEDKIKEALSRHRYKNDIVLTGWVDEEKKNDLVAGADLFLFTTFYEGFGFPILEAQMAGVPVITSNISSMPEVAGNGAILVSPHNHEDIAYAMLRMLNDAELRLDLISKGKKNTEKFSWQSCATKTLKIITHHIPI